MPQTSQAFSSSASFEPRVGTPSREEFSHPSRRPTFSSSKTSDRLSESSRLPPRLSTVKTNFKKERRSVFKELGLDDEEINHLENKPISSSPSFTSTNSSKQPGTPNRKLQKEPTDNATPPPSDEKEKPSWYRRLSRDQRPRIKSVSSAPSGLATLPRVAMIAFLIALVIPTLLQKGPAKVPADGAVAGVIPSPKLVRREDSPTDTCTRWSHQSALVKGTVYIYGGQSKTSSGQQGNTWSKYIFVHLIRSQY